MSIPVTEILGFTPMSKERGKHHKPQSELAYLEEHPDAWLTAREARCEGYVPLGGHAWTRCSLTGTWEVRGLCPGPYCAAHAASRVALREAMRKGASDE